MHFRTASPENHVKVIVRGADVARAQETLDKIEAELRKRIGAGIYGVDGDTFPMAVGRALSSHPSTVALAESCTGGMAGELLTSVPGSSAYFLGASWPTPTR